MAVATLERFTLYRRVCVHVIEGKNLGGVNGTVVRMRRCDDGAWIALDTRLGAPLDRVHPFPADDSRATHVLAFPEDCSELQ